MIFVLTLFVNLGMWFERFVIIMVSLHRDYLPSSWTYYIPSPVEIGLLIGSFGLFFTAFLLFLRIFPIIATSEIKGVLRYAKH